MMMKEEKERIVWRRRVRVEGMEVVYKEGGGK